MKEVIPEFFPITPDDLWIQLLLVALFLLILDKIDLEVKLKEK
jgi:hypothetical protein